MLARGLVRLLEQQGWECDSVDAGEEAIRLLASHRRRYDLALVDWCLGGDTDGIEVLRRLRTEDRALVGILMSGHASTALVIESMRAGAFDFLPKPFDEESLALVLQRAATYRGVLLENERYHQHLCATVERKSEALNAALDEVTRAYEATLTTLVAMLDAREHRTARHSRRVMRLARRLAEAMNLPADEVDAIGQGALLHDLGKIGIPDHILLKPGPLDDAERERIRTHPRLGYDLLKDIPAFQAAADIVLSHHERWDGMGYPRGLAGSAISLGARIFSVVDAYDAMRDERPYAEPIPPAEALQEVVRERGAQFDPDVVDALVRLHAEIERLGGWEDAREDVPSRGSSTVTETPSRTLA
jgi:putative nucleotidyltransferase with HDIG domain